MVNRCVWIAVLAAVCLPAQTQVMKYQAMTFTSARPDGQPVTGAPYSAVAVTEFVQTLPDGNRIVNKTTSSIARDSEGRTRREQTIAAIGPWTVEDGKAPQLIFLQDPVARANYLLDPAAHTVRKTPLMQFGPMGGGGVAGTVVGGVIGAPPAPPPGAALNTETRITIRAAGPPPGAPMGPGAADVMFYRAGVDSADASQVSTESLGVQTMEGVAVEGTRTKRTIAAGAMGNERPIEVVSESWYSADLQVVVYSKRNDPRIGEDTYRLTNIQRSEPAAALFAVPADYKLEEDSPGKMVPAIQFQQKLVP
jgi:hypothetical protein